MLYTIRFEDGKEETLSAKDDGAAVNKADRELELDKRTFSLYGENGRLIGRRFVNRIEPDFYRLRWEMMPDQ